MQVKNIVVFSGLLLASQCSFAQVQGGTGLPLEMGGIAVVAALSLIIATQLIKRRK